MSSGTLHRSLSVDLTSTSPIELSSSSSSVGSSVATGDNTPTETTQRGRSGILLTNGSRIRSSSLPPSHINTEHLPALDTSLLDSLSLPTSAVDSLQSSPGTSTSSLKLNVKFAPLPELPSGRRRKNTVPLGVASRGQMMRRRRMIMPPADAVNDNPMWTHEEVEAHLRKQQSGVKLHDINSPGDEMEDPLLMFGRKIKGAWKKVAKGKEKERGPTIDATQASVILAGERRIVLATIEPNESEDGREEGRVWEEEISDRFTMTETVRNSIASDGNEKYPSSKS